MNLNQEQIQYVINLLQVDAQQVLNFLASSVALAKSLNFLVDGKVRQ